MHLGHWSELELELIQPHMAQKPVLRGEVGCACVARGVLELELELIQSPEQPAFLKGWEMVCASGHLVKQVK